MAVEIKKLENSNVEFVITLEGAEVKTMRNKILGRLAKEVELPGFRKGKAPLSTIETKFAHVLKEEVAEEVLKQNFVNIIKENNIQPVDYVNTKAVELTEDKFVGTFVVDVYPEVTLGDYKGLEIAKAEAVVLEDAIEKEIEVLVDRASKLVEAEEGYRAQLNDTVTLDFEGFVDGIAFEGGKAEGYALQLGSKSFIDTFEDQLAGYAVGQEGEINVSFPTEYFKEELAGKPAMFKVKVTGIKKLEKPALDDEFAKDSGFDSLEDLKAKKQEEIKAKEEQRVESEFKNSLINQVMDNATVIIPNSMIAREVSNRIGEFENSLKQQGANMDMYLKMTGMSIDGIREQIKPMAEARVKRDIVLSKVAQAEGITTTEEEVTAKVAEIAEMYKMEVEKFKNELVKSKSYDNFIENLKVDIELEKTIDFLVANVK